MSQSGFLKCSCRQCGGPIEFPPQGVGMNIDCPHCGQKTLLGRAVSLEPTAQPLPSPSAATPDEVATTEPAVAAPRKARVPVLAAWVAILATGAVAGWWFARPKPPPAHIEAPTATNKMAALAASNAKAPVPESPPTVPDEPKSLDDLKPGAVTLEKAKSGSLMHALGTIKNESDHQRFGVRVEIGLTDAGGRTLRSATDYTAVIEPRKEWRFRALVLDSKATAAKVVSIKEDH